MTQATPPSNAPRATQGRERWVQFGAEFLANKQEQLESHVDGPLRRFMRRFVAQKSAVFAAIVLLILVLVAVFANAIAPYDPNAQDLGNVLSKPTADHWFGTDQNGRDLLSRSIFGARVSLLAALQSVGLAVLIGVIPGLLAGYLGGWVDLVVMRVVEALMSFPPLLLAIAIVGVRGPSLTSAMLAIGVAFAPRFCRLMRGVALSAREETYIEAAQSIGCSTPRILFKHLLPNVVSPLVVQISLMIGFAMLYEASLSFLGLGVTPPEASWGSMLGQAFRYITQAPWIAMPPGVLLTVAVLAFNLLGDGVRDALGRQLERGK